MRTILLTVFLCILILHPMKTQSSLQASNNTPSPGGKDGVIIGRVVGEDGQPVAKAMIECSSVGAKPGWFSSVPADADGSFKLIGLSPANYVLNTFVPGYVIDRRSREVEFHRIGERVTINLVKGGVITGQVTDANGEPVVGVRVVPRIVRDLDGNPIPMMFRSRELSRMTDDRGVYRLYGLEPGIYVVFVNRGSEYSESAKTGAAPIYYPSATRDGAAEITVQSAQEITGIDIRHRIYHGYTVSGRVVGELGAEGGANQAYVRMNNLADGQGEAGTNVTKSGGFEIRGLTDGEYEVMAYHANVGSPMAASMPRKLTIRGADVSGIELKIEKLGTISGRVAMETSGAPGKCDPSLHVSFEEILFDAKPAQGTRLKSILALYRNETGWNLGGVDRKGEFKLNNLFPGTYHLIANLPGEYTFLRSMTRPSASQYAAKSVKISANGVPVKSSENVTGIEVKIADGAANLSGKVIPAGETDKLPKRIRIHLIPAEASAANDLLRYAEADINSDEAFEFGHLAPGKYWLLAKPAIEKERDRATAWDAVERAKLRQEAEAAKNEIGLQPCQRLKDHRVYIHKQGNTANSI